MEDGGGGGARKGGLSLLNQAIMRGLEGSRMCRPSNIFHAGTIHVRKQAMQPD
jgi:hypothetical protein